MKAKVYVTLKGGILDPQGKAILQSLQQLGFTDTTDVRLGKYVEIELSSMPRDEARNKVKQMCEKLLANTVIEEYRIELQDEG